MVNSTFFINKVLGRLTTNYKIGLKDHKIMIFKVLSVKNLLNLSDSFFFEEYETRGPILSNEKKIT
jgi:hypothetical protein